MFSIDGLGHTVFLQQLLLPLVTSLFLSYPLSKTFSSPCDCVSSELRRTLCIPVAAYVFVLQSLGIKGFSLYLFLVVNSLCICSNVDGFGLEAEARMTTWHIMIPSDIEPDGVYNQDVSEGNLK